MNEDFYREKLSKMIGDRNQGELSKLSGISQPLISALKNKKRDITLNNLTALLPVLGCSLADFFETDIKEAPVTEASRIAPGESADEFYRDQIRRKDKRIDELESEVARLKALADRTRTTIAKIRKKHTPPEGVERRVFFKDILESGLS
jgi:transcriptional regulator with XRE-family HTH domain